MLRGVPVVLLAALLAATGMLAGRVNADNMREDAGQAAVTAARQEAVNLTTLRYDSAAQDLARILALSTGEVRANFAAQRQSLPGLLARQRSRSVGSALSAGLVRLDATRTRAQVAVAVDARVTAADAGEPALKHYRMMLSLEVVSGRWLVSRIAFLDRP